mmetsp:Transcript_37895/g.98375  ORF Transcript_37895/g.98375 Transcript_37895/m.98375 type:complete len:471 (+) Transcript_37895:305-1717(+)
MYKATQRRGHHPGIDGSRDAQERHRVETDTVRNQPQQRNGSPYKSASPVKTATETRDREDAPARVSRPVNAGKAKVTPPVKGPHSNITMPAVKASRTSKPSILGFHLTETRALILLNVIALMYGTNTTMMKSILMSTGKRASAATTARSLSAALAVIPILVRKPFADLRLWKAGIELGMWLGLGFAFQSNALRTSTSSEASVMLALTLVVVSILEICCGRPLTKRRVLPVLMAIGGLLLMEVGNRPMGVKSSVEPEYVSDGTLWGVASAVGFGVHLFRSDVLQEKVTDSIKLGASQLVACAGYHVVWLCLDYLFSFKKGETYRLLDHLPWWDIIFCGVFATGLAQFLELVCVKYAKASSTAIVFAQVPVWGMLLGFIVQSDRLSLVSLMGSLLVVCAAAVPYLITFIDSLYLPTLKAGTGRLRDNQQKQHVRVIPKQHAGDIERHGALSPRRRVESDFGGHCLAKKVLSP